MYRSLLIACAIVVAATALSPAAAQTQPPAQPQNPQQSSQPQQPAQPTPAPATAGTTGQLPTPQPPATAAEPKTVPAPLNAACPQADVTTALTLLDRMQRLLDDAIKDGLGKVSLDRGAVDELRAEVAQVRASIVPVK